jgi:hypothetical protein
VTKAPAADQVRLLAVQDLDTQLDQLAHRRRTTPELAALAELDARLADLHTALVTSRTAANDLRRELKKAEADVEQVRSRAQRDQTRLDSGQASVKDVQALSAELEHLAHRQGELEEIELEVMERLEAHESALGHEQSAYDEVEEQQAAGRAAVQAALAAVDAQIEQVRADRVAAVAGLDQGLVTLYEKLRTQLSGRGAGRLTGNRCDGCRMELNPSDVHRIHPEEPDEVVRCEECGRILVRS